MSAADKPCDACPWTKPGRPDIPPDILAAAQAGRWFCCHGRGGGTCIGAAAEVKRSGKAAAAECTVCRAPMPRPESFCPIKNCPHNHGLTGSPHWPHGPESKRSGR